jgi:YD repeat-containing protein
MARLGYTFQNMLITSLKDANGNRTEQRYDGQGRLSRRVYPSKTQAGQLNESDYQEYRYDPNSNLAWERKRSGATFNYSYDALNRRTAKLPASGRSVHYGYDLRGLQLSARFDTANGPGILNQYDGFGQLRQTTNTLGVSRALTYAYDLNGNRTRLRMVFLSPISSTAWIA